VRIDSRLSEAKQLVYLLEMKRKVRIDSRLSEAKHELSGELKETRKGVGLLELGS
jgi:hypothetical protein